MKTETIKKLVRTSILGLFFMCSVLLAGRMALCAKHHLQVDLKKSDMTTDETAKGQAHRLKKKKKKKSQRWYTPKERITADQAVAFPVDI